MKAIVTIQQLVNEALKAGWITRTSAALQLIRAGLTYREFRKIQDYLEGRASVEESSNLVFLSMNKVLVNSTYIVEAQELRATHYNEYVYKVCRQPDAEALTA